MYVEIPPDALQASPCTVSFEPLVQSLRHKFSKEDFQTYLRLFEKVQKSPKETLSELQAFHRKNPQSPEIANLLSFAYLHHRNILSAEKLIEETYRNHPEYFFGKINYADQCLRQQKFDAIPTIFHHTFDISKLYPDKKIFHFSEYRSFMVVMGFYHLAIEDKKQAHLFYEKAMLIDPLHSSVIALEKKIFHTPFLKKMQKALQKLAPFLSNP